MKSRAFRIGEAAKRAGVSTDTLRYYERRGLLPKAPRNGAGYRLYEDAAVLRIQFVRNALRFGFSLKQIARFTRSRDAGQPPCHEVRNAAREILTKMDRHIAELTAARRAGRDMLIDWDQRLSRTPAGTAARLLETLAFFPRARSVKPHRPAVSRG